MIGGNEANLALVGYEPEKVKRLAKLAHELGVLIHIEGIPFGDSTQSSRVEGLGVFGSYQSCGTREEWEPYMLSSVRSLPVDWGR